MEKRKIVNSEYQQLISLREMSILNAEIPHQIDLFYQELMIAKVFPRDEISNEVITMNSRIKLKEKKTGKLIRIILSYPEYANPNEFKVSVFSSIGMSLLGRSVGDFVTWKIHNLRTQFEVMEVYHQDEMIEDLVNEISPINTA